MNSAPVATSDTFTFAVTSPIQKGHVKLAWDDPHNASRGMLSYYLYYWQSGWDKPKRIDVGSQTHYTLHSLDTGTLYTFAVTVHDGNGSKESIFSNKISYEVPTDKINEISQFQIQSIDILANDYDQDSDNLTIQIVSGPRHGKIILQPDGGLTYIPNVNFHQGMDRMTYHVNDGTLNSNIATITIYLKPPQLHP